MHAFNSNATTVKKNKCAIRNLIAHLILIIHLAIVAGLFGYMIGNPASDFRNGLIEGWQGK